MKETDELLLFIERMAAIKVLIDKECIREWLSNFTNNELKNFMLKIYQEMLFFMKKPFDFLGRGKTFEKLTTSSSSRPNIIFCRYKYKCSNKKNLRSIFIIILVNNEYKAVFLHTFLEDGNKKNSKGSKSYKQAIKVAKKRLDDNYKVEGD